MARTLSPLLLLPLLAPLFAATPLFDRTGEVSLSPSTYNWSSFPYLMDDPTSPGSLPREGAPGDPAVSTSSLRPLTMLPGQGMCATLVGVPTDGGRVRITPTGTSPLALSGEDIVISALSTTAPAPVTMSHSSSIDPSMLTEHPWAVFRTGAVSDVRVCLDLGTLNYPATVTFEPILPRTTVTAAGPAITEPGGPLRLEARLTGRGSRANPVTSSVVATRSSGATLWLNDSGYNGDVISGDGIWSVMTTADTDADTEFVLTATGTLLGKTISNTTGLVIPTAATDGTIQSARATPTYLRVVVSGASPGAAVDATFGSNGRILGFSAARVGWDGAELVAWLPRPASLASANRVVLRLAPAAGGKQADYASFVF